MTYDRRGALKTAGTLRSDLWKIQEQMGKVREKFLEDTLKALVKELDKDSRVTTIKPGKRYLYLRGDFGEEMGIQFSYSVMAGEDTYIDWHDEKSSKEGNYYADESTPQTAARDIARNILRDF